MNEPVLTTIGEISVTQHSVLLPHGQYPLRGTTWNVQDATQTYEVIPTYAIVLAVVTAVFTCFLGLLFLLIKEPRYTGHVLVSVSGPGLYYGTQLPPGPEWAQWAWQQVNYVRNLAANA